MASGEAAWERGTRYLGLGLSPRHVADQDPEAAATMAEATWEPVGRPLGALLV